MDLNRWIENTLKIQAIPAPTFSEMQRSDFMRGAFEASGVERVEQDDLDNVYAHIPGGNARALVISAHLDSVFPLDTALDSSRSAEHLAGPGIGDNAVALAALIELAVDLPSIDLAGDVWLIANVGEEALGNLRGMRRVVDRFSNRVCAYIALEGMVLGHIFHRALPVKRFRIRASTAGGHSWIHAGRPSAIHSMMQLGNQLLNLHLPEEPRTTLNIGCIQGGTSINSIAPACHIDVDIRSDDSRTLASISRKVERIARRHRSRTVRIEVELIGERPAGGLPTDHPLVQAARRALEQAGEGRVTLQAGSTDASLPLSRGIPAVCVGLTRGSGAHSLEERILIDPLPRGYEALLDLIHASFYLKP
jgi:acetylornithine deacetylase/succinyl-diaminopimelate desuccinylase-like protein